MDFNKKEMPIQGFAGFGGGATSAAFRSSGISSKYIDDVFGTEVYEGTGSNKTITNDINLSSEGGMVWVKNRDQNYNHWLFTSSMGIGNAMRTNNTNDKWGFGSAGMVSFNSDGYTVGTHQGVNNSGDNMVAWTFRNSKAFQQLTYEGTGVAQNIPHSLGSIPGMVIVKNIDTSSTNWSVYHRNFLDETWGTPDKFIFLNSTAEASGVSHTQYWNSTSPTATQFTVGTHNDVNKDGDTYIAYVFAGGPSYTPYAAGRSVAFDGNGDDLRWASNTDFAMGTGDFTLECWIKPSNWSSTYMTVFCVGSGSNTGGLWLGKNQSNFVVRSYSVADYIQTTEFPPIGQWTHVAAARSGTTLKLFYNGIEQKSVTNSYDFQGGDDIWVSNDAYDNRFVGNISNVRLVKGTAVYTGSFRAPTEPLTNITNTKLLCCNAGASVTGSTVTPGTITANGNPSSVHDTPFDDPDGFAFGEDEDEIVVKTGTYVGNGNATGPKVYLGWEPQYVLIKRVDGAEDWKMYDSMRGISTGHNDQELRPESSALEYSYSRVDLTSTGFQPMTDNQYTNEDGGEFIYLCIRRPDGIVGKPAEAGTDVFNIVDGDTDGVDPFFKNIGFPVDLGLFKKKTDSSHNWGMSPRLTQKYYLSSSDNRSENSNTHQMFDYMSAWNSGTDTGGGYFTYAWKRHAGFDVVTWTGTNSSVERIHNLGKIPEMIWFKNRSSARDWKVYHKGLNGGTNPEDYDVELNTANAQSSNTNYMTSTAPTSTTFVSGNDDDTNGSGSNYIAMLFASVDGISKVGSFSGSNSSQTITTGFQPRFLIIKNATLDTSWQVLDTTRGWASGNDKRLFLDTTSDESTGDDVGQPTSTGFTLTGGDTRWNASSHTFIYYTHA